MAPPRRRRPPRAPAAPPPPTPPEDYQRWKARIAQAVELRTAWETDYAVEEGERYFLGTQQETALVLNHFAATIKTSRPNLFIQSPKFFVRPKPGRTAPVAERIAALAEGALEAIARQDDNLEQAGALAVLQAYFRVGALKIIYDPRMEPNPAAGRPIYQTEHGEPVVDDLGEPQVMKNPLTGEVLTEPVTVLTDEVYRWSWVDAASLVLPDEGPDPSKWTWIGEEVVVPLEQAKADERFPAAVRARLRANERPRPRRGRVARMSPDEWFKYTEIYRIRDKRFLVLAEGQDEEDFLLDAPVPAWIDNDPYALLCLGEPILGPEPLPWPVPVVRDWISPQNEYNIRRRQIMEGAKRSARKGVYDDGTFADADEAVKLLQSPEDMVFAKVQDVTRPPILLTTPDLNPSIYKDIPFLQLDWRLITGQTGARLADPEGDSATEATFVERAANLRDSEMQRKVVTWLSSAGRKMFQCLKETLTLDLYVQMREMGDAEFQSYVERVYGVAAGQLEMLAQTFPGLKEAVRAQIGQQKWLRVTRSQLHFEADVSIAPGSTRPRNLDVERRQWLDFLRVIGQFPQLALSRELLRETAAKFEYISDRMLDELTLLAKQMVEINARQAGRDQGGANGQPGGAQTPGILAAAMSQLAGGG